jgi:hypothetical protein
VNNLKTAKGSKSTAARAAVPPDVLKQWEEGHAKAEQIGKQVCEAAAQGSRLLSPSPIGVPAG